MSMKKKLDDAYRLGEQSERGRVLWLMEKMRNDLREQLEKKILIESSRHVVQTKIKMVTSLFLQLQHLIVSNKQPPPKPKEPDNSKGVDMIDEAVERWSKEDE